MQLELRLASRVRLLLTGAILGSFTLISTITSATAQAGRWFSPRPEQNMTDDQPGYVPHSDEERLPAEYQKQMVFFRTTEPPGTIIVNTSERFLYLVKGNNRAIRYGIGVGREGFQWAGLRRIDRKAEWPDWTPPPEMIERQPYLPRFMAGGPGNPMGAISVHEVIWEVNENTRK
jgi:lipoprotein-anchoring transpeptidase ErfK/SrfK